MEALILFLPLLGAILAKPLGYAAGPRVAEVTTTVFVGIAALFSWIVFFDVAANGAKQTIEFWTWIEVGQFRSAWSMRLDTLTAVMLIVVTTVSSLVHCYSIGYMHEDPSRARFFAYLSFFTFTMLMLVTAADLVQLFFGWEGVGVASYLLIGFWHHKGSANDAAIKAFVMNRVGDVGLALGIMGVFVTFGSVAFDPIFEALRSGFVTPLYADGAVALGDLSLKFLDRTYPVLEIVGVLLFIGAMGKSAQFLLHTWLPDAMEGPTPVSALIHAATMVTAGVFLVCRMSELYALTPVASGLITFIGATTAIFAATIGLVQTDIKRVIAYSTASQLGYMFFAAGVGGYAQAMFHLTTHAFFKALLFLGAGAVIHFSHHEQDMRRMGGLKSGMPATFVMMLAGTLAITGVGIPTISLFGAPFGFAGFVSKDYILEAAYDGITSGKAFAVYAFVLGLIAAVLTAFYSWRLIFLTFDGESRAPAEVRQHPHKVPLVMLAPIVPLAIGAVFAGMAFYKPFVGGGSTAFWDGSLHLESHYAATDEAGHGEVPHPARPEEGAAAAVDHGEPYAGGYNQTGYGERAYGEGDHAEEAHHTYPLWVYWAPFLAMLIGFVVAFFQYRTVSDPLRRGAIGPGGLLYTFLQNRWFIDDLYRVAFLQPARIIARILWKQGDERIIDGLGPNGISGLAGIGSRGLVRGQTGFVFTYAFVMLIGVVAILLFVLLRSA